MKPVLRLVPAFSVLLLSSVSALAAQQSLPLKRVVITTSGLALYEHDGTVTGDADIGLSVRLDSVDDVLKSLTVLDDKGSIGGISLPGREPLSQAFRDLPFGQEDLGSLTGLLNALRGAEVQISSGAQVAAGRLLTVTPENEQTKDGIVTRNRVGVSTKDGVKTFLLEELSALKFVDADVQAQLDRALAAMFSSRIRDRRTVDVSLKGAGARPVTLAYIQAAPLWKSGYRLVLPDAEEKEGKAVIQGWAVLENTTGADWDNVSITLTSGSPVTYTQALYESYYLPRPELPVRVMNRVMPRVDRGSVGTADAIEGGAAGAGRAARLGEMKMMKSMEAEADMAMPQDAMRYEMAGNLAAAPAAMPPMPANPSMGMAGGEQTALAQDAAGQMTFTFPEPVTLSAGNTLMVPFISEAFPAERLWVYQPETDATHPLAAVELKNAGKGGLPPGILTLYDHSGAGGGLIHVGDAEMPLTPKGEHRFIPFALDADTSIDRQTQQDRRLGLITVSRGVLRQKAVWLNTTAYAVKAPAEEGRLIVIEHPRMPGWELVKPEGIEGEPEVTPTHYRLRLRVPAGKTVTLKVTLRREDEESLTLADLGPEDLRARVAAAGKDLPEDLRAALAKVITLRTAVYDIDMEVQTIANERQAITDDQARMRENIRAVGTTSAVGKRYLDKMQAQEDRLADLEEKEKELNERRAEARRALEEFIQTIDL